MEIKIRLHPDVADKLNLNASMRAMVYCAVEPMASFAKADIAFPSQIEIRVNGDEVKANFKGLKNKPGSTNPTDITPLLRKKASFENVMSVTYALTVKVSHILHERLKRPPQGAIESMLILRQKFYMIVNLVQQFDPESLEARLRAGRFISEEQVIRESTQRIPAAGSTLLTVAKCGAKDKTRISSPPPLSCP